MVAPNSVKPTRLFQLGFITATPGALASLQKSGDDIAAFLDRHAGGDWGDVCAADAKANDDAIAHEGDEAQQERVLSAYHTKGNAKIWIITEASRESSCILLPDDF